MPPTRSPLERRRAAPDGRFDSGLLVSGGSYEWSPAEYGEYPYFCMVHPWMTGTIMTGDGILPPEPPSDVVLGISPDRNVYDLNEVAVMDVFIIGNTDTKNVGIEFTGPGGETVSTRTLSMGPNDSIAHEFRIGEDSRAGNYQVTATATDGDVTVLDTAHFKVKSQFDSFQISSVQVTDQRGNPAGLSPNGMGFVKVGLESGKSIASLITVNIFDSDLTSIGIGSVSTTLSSGESEIILSFMIPQGVARGTADIYVNAFSGWPSDGGIPLTGEAAISEEIR